MKAKDEFLQAYQAQVLQELALPPSLSVLYRVWGCLKDGERQVYLVKDQAGRQAVLKLQPAGREDTLLQEYELLCGLRHPQIPRPITYLEWEGTEYLVREYVEGVSLYEMVSARGMLHPAQVRAITLSLCEVLCYLHSQKPPVICRDVKPQNVVLDASGQCHLIDMGAARHHSQGKQTDTVFLGTQATAPPEQFGYQQTDQRSDVYSLGVLMRFLCTGSFEPLPSGADVGCLRRVIARCTAFDPKNRYPSVRAVYRALRYRLQRRMAIVLASVICLTVVFSLFGRSNSEVQPRSSLLEDAIRYELQLQKGEPIPMERLGEVEQLLVCGQSLVGTIQEHEEFINSAHDRYASETSHGDIGDEDLALLAQCTNLRVLVLDYQQVSDLSPLAELPLEYLSLTGNLVSDLRPLSELNGLQMLDLGENPVRSVEALSGLTELQQLTLEATGIRSVDSLQGSNIRFLNVRSTEVADLSPLESCPNLARLIVGEMPDGAAQTLSGLTGLEELRLYATQEVDLSHFAGLQKLRNLDVYGSTISHPEALVLLPELRYVNLGATGLHDSSFLIQMPALTDVDLRDNSIAGLTPLLDCPWLSLLILSEQHRPLAQEQLSHASFQIVYQ